MPIFKEYYTPFSLSSYYLYIDSFLRGFDIEVLIEGSKLCIDAAVYSVDEFLYFANNISDAKISEWQLPVMNFTKTVASNFSSAIVNCYEFTNKTYYFLIVRFASQFDNDIAYLLNSFLFNLLGKALTIKNIFDNIMTEIENYNFYEVAYHYGRLVRTLFYFDAIILGALEDLKDENGNIMWAERFQEVLERA
jgi:hypothetical protein